MASTIYACKMPLVQRLPGALIFRNPSSFEELKLPHGVNHKTLLITECCKKAVLKRDLKETPSECKSCNQTIEALDHVKHYTAADAMHVKNFTRLYQAARVKVLNIKTNQGESFDIGVNPYTNEVIDLCKTQNGKKYARPKIDPKVDVKPEIDPNISVNATAFFEDVAMTQCGHLLSLQEEIPELCPGSGCNKHLHKEQIGNIDNYEEESEDEHITAPPLPVIKEELEEEEEGDPASYQLPHTYQPPLPHAYAPQLGPALTHHDHHEESNLISTRSAVIATIISTVAATVFFVIEAVFIPSNLLLLAGRLCLLSSLTSISFAISNVLKGTGVFNIALQVAVLWRAYAINCKEVYAILSIAHPYLAVASIAVAIALPILYNFANSV